MTLRNIVWDRNLRFFSAKLSLLHLLAKLATLEASASSSASQSYPIVELLCNSIVAHLANYSQLEKVNSVSLTLHWTNYFCWLLATLLLSKLGFVFFAPLCRLKYNMAIQLGSWVHEKNTNTEPLVSWQGRRRDAKLYESLKGNSLKMVIRFAAFITGTNCDIWWTSPCGRICMS